MHKSKFIFQSLKKQALLDYLLNGVIKSKRYCLILVSCYFNINSANEIISLLKDSINLSKTSIYIDRGSAINIGKENITNWIKELSKSENVSFKIADSASLFHVKAYCLLADDFTCGSLVVGSANLTGNGLTTETGSIELLYEIHNIEDILCFYHELTSNNVQKFIDISELEKFNNTEDDYFKYALLQEECFVKSNDLSINELLSFTYNFNEKGRKESKSLEFKELELKDKNSYSKNYFEKIYPVIENIFRKYNFSYDVKWGKYGVNTDFGYWIPKNIIAYLNREDEKTLKDLECCKSEIKQELTSHLNTAKILMEDQWKNLLEKDWLTDNFKPQMTKIDNGILDLYIKTETEKHLRKKMIPLYCL
ncbi:MAG TPA: phospholipase D family protein [Nostoc sp.]|uniref:phospholipase D family protein n=1 Tax=Nostoc sp. TaxID=1180 RepID=UPI002D3A6C53|nr:phospholipase D family protein [Nostoc sp.]HYX16871.1 phospholipase D family protein [Nostoc sp.]